LISKIFVRAPYGELFLSGVSKMLGGIAPILIFTFPPLLGIDLSKILSGIPLIGDSLSGIGVPIPLYLDEGLTGLYVESETKAIDIDTDITPIYRKTTNEITNYVNQSGLNNIITVNMLASRDNVFLAVLLALNDMVFERVVQTKYRVSYFNKSILLFGGLLHSFSTQASNNDDLLRITLQIQKSKKTLDKLNSGISIVSEAAAKTGGLPL